MPAPATLVQKNQGASSVAAPATFTQNWGSNTTAGTLLVAVVAGAMSASAGSVAMPAGYVLQTSSFTTANISLAVYAWVSNPGGLGNVFCNTLVNYNGIAVAIFEIAGAVGIDNRAILQATSAASTSPASGAFTPTLGNEVYVGAIAWLTGGGALTGGNTPTAGPGAWTASTLATSTTGATNVNLQAYISFGGPVFPNGGSYQVAGTVTSTGVSASLLGIATLASTAIVSNPDAGAQGYLAGGQYQGAIGG